MSKKIQLSIAEPCHENWESMSPVEKGKFCGSCQKQVVDFTDMNDYQVAQFFKKPSTGSVCGRFMTEQLDRPIAIPRKRIPWLKYFFQIALPALFISKASAQDQKMGKPAMQARDTSKVRVTQEMRTLGMVLPTSIMPEVEKKTPLITKGETKPVTITTTINGRVVDEKGEPVPFASVVTNKPGKGVVADEQGNFTIPVTYLEKDSVLRFAAVGFESLTLAVNKEDALESSLNVDLKPNFQLQEVILIKSGLISCTYLTGEVIVVQKPVNSKKITEKIAPSLKNSNDNKLTVYPNPIATDNIIHLGLKNLKE